MHCIETLALSTSLANTVLRCFELPCAPVNLFDI